jgi:hypothetical protein
MKPMKIKLNRPDLITHYTYKLTIFSFKIIEDYGLKESNGGIWQALKTISWNE